MRILFFLFSICLLSACAVDEEVPCIGDGPSNSICKVYEFTNGVYDARQDFQYDDEGKIIARKTSKVQNDYYVQSMFTYTAANLIDEVIVSEEGEYKYTKKYKYNADQKVLKILFEDYRKLDSLVHTYTAGTLMLIEGYKSGIAINSTTFSYNANQLLIEQVFFENNQWKETVMFEYFSNNTVERTIYDELNNLQARFIDVFNDNDQLLQSSAFTPENNLNTKTVYELSNDSVVGVIVLDSLDRNINERQYIRF